VGIGVTGQELQRGDAVVGPQHSIPGRPEKLDERVESGIDSNPALDHRGALLDQPPQRVRGALAGVLPQPFGMQQR
jgi:hypothetical protein